VSRSGADVTAGKREFYPAADPDVFAVTATDSRNDLFKAANHGAYVAVAAPGVNILAIAPGGSYQITMGTSIAAAYVSGVAALLLQCEPLLKPKGIRAIVTATAKPLAGAVKQRSDSGVGLVDACGALASVDKTSAKRCASVVPERLCLLSRCARRDTISAPIRRDLKMTPCRAANIPGLRSQTRNCWSCGLRI
jgi:hypothetical protein